MQEIELRLNGEPHRAPAGTLADLVAALEADPASLATVVNGRFVPRTARTECRLVEGDQVLTFRPIVGG